MASPAFGRLPSFVSGTGTGCSNDSDMFTSLPIKSQPTVRVSFFPAATWMMLLVSVSTVHDRHISSAGCPLSKHAKPTVVNTDSWLLSLTQLKHSERNHDTGSVHAVKIRSRVDSGRLNPHSALSPPRSRARLHLFFARSQSPTRMQIAAHKR